MKLYCVHVYERAHEHLLYENVRAKNPQDAEFQVMHREFNGDYDNIDHVEVMRQCDCGQDNPLEDKKCSDCGKKL